MKIYLMIFLTLGLITQSISQDIESLEKLETQLTSGRLTTFDSIETLNLLSQRLTFINRSKALLYANKALELSVKINYAAGTAYAYRILASIYTYNDSFFIGMEYMQMALDIFIEQNDTTGIANCYISLGHIYRRLKYRKEEIDYHKKSYEIFKNLNDKERIGVTAHNLGESYYNDGDIINARKLTLYAIHINDSINNQPVLSSCYKVLGMIELSDKNYALAESNFKKVLDITADLGEYSQKVAAAESMIQLAMLYKINGDYENQFNFLIKASEFSSKNNLPNYLQRAFQELISYSATKNDLKGIEKYNKSYKEISDSLELREIQDRYSLVKNVEQVHKLAKTKKEIEKINLIQAQRIKSRNITLFVVIIFATILFWLLIKFIRLNKKLKSQYLIIELQKNDLEVLNNTKNKFFNIVAHDLKSPLNGLQSYSSLLIDHFDQLSKDEIISIGTELQNSVSNTIKMADNLITWALVQMKQYQYNQEIILIEELVSVIFDVYKETALKKGIKISSSIEDSLTVKGDKNQLEFVLRNLVNNAIKYTNKGGYVLVKAESLPNGEVQISVSDNGVGISEESRGKLFTIGKNQSTNGTLGEKGTGIGLMLSYEFVKLNDGEIEIESNAGLGTTFYVKFKNGNLK